VLSLQLNWDLMCWAHPDQALRCALYAVCLVLLVSAAVAAAKAVLAAGGVHKAAHHNHG